MAVPNPVQSCLHNGSMDEYVCLNEYLLYATLQKLLHCVLLALLYFSVFFYSHIQIQFDLLFGASV